MKERVSVGEVLAALVLLPPLAYGAGFLLWIGPSKVLFGVNVAPLLSPGALLFPGAIYVGVLILSGLFAAMIGVERLAQPAVSTSREAGVGFELFFWVLILAGANGVAFAVVRGVVPLFLFGLELESAYLVIHVVVVGFGFRRLVGLTRARLNPPANDTRNWTSRLRVLQASAVVAALYTQVALALLYGVLGPNPAKNRPHVTVHQGGHSMPALLLDDTEERVLIFDLEEGAVKSVSKANDVEIQLTPPS